MLVGLGLQQDSSRSKPCPLRQESPDLGFLVFVVLLFCCWKEEGGRKSRGLKDRDFILLAGPLFPRATELPDVWGGVSRQNSDSINMMSLCIAKFCLFSLFPSPYT